MNHHINVSRGENNGSSKLKSADIPEIRKMLDEGKSRKEIGKMYNVTPGTIRDIDLGKTWVHV